VLRCQAIIWQTSPASCQRCQLGQHRTMAARRPEHIPTTMEILNNPTLRRLCRLYPLELQRARRGFEVLPRKNRSFGRVEKDLRLAFESNAQLLRCCPRQVRLFEQSQNQVRQMQAKGHLRPVYFRWRPKFLPQYFPRQTVPILGYLSER